MGLVVWGSLTAAFPMLAFSGEPVKTSEWEYPELVVSPRASERLEREAKAEKSSQAMHWPVQLSGAMTFAAGLLQFAQPDRARDPDRYAAWTGVGVGGAWLLATWLMQQNYEPYSDGHADVSAMPSKTQREQLARERAAEQVIHDAARNGRRLQWFSFVSNAAAAAYLVSNARNDSVAKIASVGALVTSLTPLLFPSHWIDVEKQQSDYKKRIFGPVMGWTTVPSRGTAPVVGLQWNL
jgi:hypothetical protein